MALHKQRLLTNCSVVFFAIDLPLLKNRIANLGKRGTAGD
jgi:hypothetical protein